MTERSASIENVLKSFHSKATTNNAPSGFSGWGVLLSGAAAGSWRGHTYLIAHPEKAFLDLAYLEPRFSNHDWLEEMRFDYWGLKEDIDWERMDRYLRRFDSNVVNERIELLKKTYEL